MKGFKTILLCCIVACFVSCDNDFDLTMDWQDIPVVYGLLSQQDTAHYIRVEKAFLDPSESALVIAQRPDSLYYEQAEVTLTRVSTGEVFTLERVDANAEGYVRDEGVFADMPNFVYKVAAADIQLELGEDYLFTLNRDENQSPVTATVPIVGTVLVESPTPNTQIRWKRDQDVSFTWRKGENADFYDLEGIIYIDQETAVGSNEFETLDIHWNLGGGLQGPDGSIRVSTKVDGADFFKAIAAGVTGEDNLRRIYRGFDVVVRGGGADLAEYVGTINVNTGITSSQVIPTFTNLSEGFGVLSSISTTTVTGYGIGSETRDSLVEGSITGHLNFQ